MNKVEIYYFSGTGNSLHAARELQKSIPGSDLIPIAGVLRNETPESKADIVGFVFPVHAFTAPIIVKNFLKKVNLNSATYIFAIATKGGSPSIAMKEIDRIIRKKGKALSSYFELKMPNNSIIFHELDTPEEMKISESIMKEKMEIIQKVIVNKEKSLEKDPEVKFFNGNILFPVIGAASSQIFRAMFPFSSDSKCSGCGICEKVCLSNKIKMKNKKPEWRKNIRCTFCFACINYCPVKAVQIKESKTNILERYHHPEITAGDIAGQKKVREDL